MHVTDDMIDAALKKAIEVGWLPRNAMHIDPVYNIDIMRSILQAALDAQPEVKEDN